MPRVPSNATTPPDLFTEHALRERLRDHRLWVNCDAEALLAQLQALLGRARPLLDGNPSEAQTEDEWVRPVLELLGLERLVVPRSTAAAVQRFPDYALYRSRADHDRAAAATDDAGRFTDAIAIAEAKRYERPLDRRTRDTARDRGTLSEHPVAQVLAYIAFTKVGWGMLTNGREWRLYSASDLTSLACHRIDLIQAIDNGDVDTVREFGALFGRMAFEESAHGGVLLDELLSDARANARQLEEQLYERVSLALPPLAGGLLGSTQRTQEELDAAFEHSLVVLFRILFCLFAEARGLLPIDNADYRYYSLRQLREQIADRLDAARPYSASGDNLWASLKTLWRHINLGDTQLGITAYNGGLFDPERYPWLAGRGVADDALAQAVDALARDADRSFIDYRDLNVRHLGTVYERILAFRLGEDTGGSLTLVADERRSDTGAFFTPHEIVDRIVERAVLPRLELHAAAIREAELDADAALDRFLGFRVCDPAMGSGHFLVGAVAAIARFIATDPAYNDGELGLEEIQRLVAERCIYGVDRNPLAVELARLSLWLDTALPGVPLAFNDKLRCGDSLQAHMLNASESTLAVDSFRSEATALFAQLAELAQMRSDTVDEVHEKERVAADIDEVLARIRELRPEEEVGLQWELEFPDVFLGEDGERREDGGFDAVVGNPPYVSVGRIPASEKTRIKSVFATASGRFDLYVPFIERGFELLAPGGRLGYIVPNRFFKTEYGKDLRSWLSERNAVVELIDFSHHQVFEDATNYTCVVVLERGDLERQTAYRWVAPGDGPYRDALVSFEHVDAEQYDLSTFASNPWVLAPRETRAILNRMLDSGVTLADIAHVFTGIQTSADDVYLLDVIARTSAGVRCHCKRTRSEVLIEPDLLHPIVSGPDVEPYAFQPTSTHVLFPYHVDEEGKTSDLSAADIASLPMTHEYLLAHETYLRGRASNSTRRIRDGALVPVNNMDHDAWFLYPVEKNHDLQKTVKLGVAATVQHLEIAADPVGERFFHNVRVNGITPNADSDWTLFSLLALLQSRTLDWFFRKSAIELENDHYQANKQYIEPLPIPAVDEVVIESLASLGERLAEDSLALNQERAGFASWVAGLLGIEARQLPAPQAVAAYDALTPSEFFSKLRKPTSARGLRPVIDSRLFREQVEREHSASVGRIIALRRRIDSHRHDVDDIVDASFELSDADKREMFGH